ncbi:MAG TPA: LytTR family DNA-binding domain-containing protein [Chryseolinea sp.]|nr:LytTR family DNA-binding domain-containing protein [Chryseolinea sp.]
MLKSIIIDDELKSRETLRKMVTSYCEGIEVLATCQNLKEAIEAINTLTPDVVFLDVQMQGETGFDLLSKLEDIKFEVIFTTAHSEYALKALRSSAIDYLLKPIDIGDLQKAVAKVEKKQDIHFTERLQQLLQNLNVTNSENYKLAIPTSDGLIFIKANDILYCKASGNYTEIYMIDGKKHLVSRQLKEYEDILNTRDFFRIHHSFLINLNCIKSYVRGEGGYVVMSDNTSIDVSRRKKEAFMERIGSRG